MSATKGRWRDSHRPQREQRGRGDADDREEDIGAGEPSVTASAASVWRFFDHREAAGDQHEHRRIDGPGVVLLIGRDGEEDQDEAGVEREQQAGAGTEAQARGERRRFVGGQFGVEELDGVGGVVAQVGIEEVAVAPCAAQNHGQEKAPREEPDELAEPEDVPGLAVVVVRVARARGSAGSAR